MVHISLIGCGRWGRHILRDLVALGCDVAVADTAGEARRIAVETGAREVVSDLADLSESEGIVIATPTATHASILERALARDVPMFVEKPMTSSFHTARMLAERAQGRLFVMDKWRYHPGIEELRRIRQSCELGRPLGMQLIHAGWGLPHRDVDVVWILLPHCLSILLEVFGALPGAKQAFAEQLNGEVVTLSGVLGTDPWARFEVSCRSPVKRREFRLHCENGVGWVDDGWTDHIKLARGKDGIGGNAENVERRCVSTELPLLRELRAFIEHLRGGPPPRSGASDGALIVERIVELRELAGAFK
jgi:predicted dehydrogenase